MAIAEKERWSELLRHNREKQSRTARPMLAVTPEEEERWSELLRQRNEKQPGNSQTSLAVTPFGSQALTLSSAVSVHERLRTLPEYWHSIRRSKRSILIPALLCGLVAFFVSRAQAPSYQASTALELQPVNENFFNTKTVDPTSAAISQESYLQTQAELLESDALMERVSKKMSVSHPEVSSNSPQSDKISLIGQAKRLFGLPSAPANEQDEALDRVRAGIKIKSSPLSRIIRIVSEAKDPVVAADLANAVATEYIDSSLESRWAGSQRTNEWLARQLADVKSKLEKSERDLQEYTRQSGLIIAGEHGNVAQDKLKQLQEELSKAQADYVTKRSEYEMALVTQPDSVPAVLDNTVLGEYQVKLAEMRRQLAELNATLTPTHYRVKRLQEQIGDLQAAFEKKRADILRRIANEQEAARRRESMLSAAYLEQTGVLSDQSGKEIKYNILKREVDASRQMYDALLQRVKESNVASAMHATNIRIADSARPPRRPFKPNVALNTLTGFLTGLFGALMIVILREASDKTIRTLGETNSYTQAPELGVISYAKALERKALPAGQSGVISEPRLSPVLADSLRTALASLLISSDGSSGPHSIAITSPGPSEGKTTVAGNIAILLAQMGQRVVLVDADARKPKLHEIFGISRNRGLSDLLNDPYPMAQLAAGDLAEPTKMQGLYVLSAGSDLESLSDFAWATRMPALLHRLEREFDFVIIDTPPVLNLPTARILGRMADGVILVIRYGVTTPEATVRASSYLKNDSSRLLGTILNSWDPSISYYGYAGSQDIVPSKASS